MNRTVWRTRNSKQFSEQGSAEPNIFGLAAAILAIMLLGMSISLWLNPPQKSEPPKQVTDTVEVNPPTPAPPAPSLDDIFEMEESQ